MLSFLQTAPPSATSPETKVETMFPQQGGLKSPRKRATDAKLVNHRSSIFMDADLDAFLVEVFRVLPAR